LWSIANGLAVPAPVGYVVERRGLCRAVCGFQLRRVERLSVELQCELDGITPVPTCPHIHLVFFPLKCLQSDFGTVLHHTALDVQQRLGPQHTRAGPDASTAALRIWVLMGFPERGEYGREAVCGCFVCSFQHFPFSELSPFVPFLPFVHSSITPQLSFIYQSASLSRVSTLLTIS
jgi:hypothetical protein